MAGYVGRGQPVAVEDNSVETADIIDGAVTDAKLNSTKLNAIADNANNYVKPSNEPISYITGLQTAINAKVSSETGKSLITDTVLATLLSDVGALESLVTSDESTLDTLQEIVDFIEANKSTLDALGISSIAGLSSALAGKVDDSQVLTNVPASAVFTDTVYSKPSAEPISYITNLQTELDDIETLALAGL
jgi:hypothetical protein